MSVFEFVLALTSVISGLALAHMLTGVVALLRNAKRVKFSFIHALWMWSAFSTTVANWASDWSLRALNDWPAWTLLLLIASKIAQYIFCAFVTPDMPAEGNLDLAAFHEREHRKYLWAVVAFCAVALAFNFAFGAADFYGQWLRDSPSASSRSRLRSRRSSSVRAGCRPSAPAFSRVSRLTSCWP